MVMKNKLYKHHKSKAVYVLRRFSFALFGLIATGLAIGIPTYISSLSENQIATKAEENKSEKVESQDQDNSNTEDSLLAYK